MAATIRSSVDVAGALMKLRNGERQVRFAVTRALTQTAKAAQGELTVALPQIFDRPTPFTRAAIAILPARRETLEATVLVKDRQAEYLAIQETGGTRLPRPGSPIVVAVRIAVNAFGNIARGRIRRERQKPSVFVARRDDPRTRHLPPGIYRRGRRPRGRGVAKAAPLKLLVAVERAAEYRPRFGMKARVAATARRVFPALFARSLDDALKTAK